MTQRHEESDDDTYVSLGSAFEKLETVEDVEKAKRKKDKEQYVTDDRGRRRFHGAFTGGFSAGYFNTVGSEEGRQVLHGRPHRAYRPSHLQWVWFHENSSIASSCTNCPYHVIRVCSRVCFRQTGNNIYVSGQEIP